MYCRKCGNKMGDSEKFCTRCGTKVEPTDINTPAPQMFMYNDINKNINNNASDGELIRAYIGSKENKMYYKAISKKGFNIWAYLFGAVYYAYRKLYIASLIIIVINILIIYVLKLNYLLAFVNILYACLFYKIYGTHIEKQVDKIKNKNPNATRDELIRKCSRKGGISILSPLVILIISFVCSYIGLITTASDNTKLVGTWDCQGVDNDRLLTQFNTDSSFNYSGYYNPNSNYIKGTYKIYKATNDTYLLLLISDEVVKDGTKTTGFNYSLNTIIINDDNLQLGESYTCKRSTSLY